MCGYFDVFFFLFQGYLSFGLVSFYTIRSTIKKNTSLLKSLYGQYYFAVYVTVYGKTNLIPQT